VLRAAVGLTTIAQGSVYLFSRDDSALQHWVIGSLSLTTGSLLLIGFLTPFACLLVVLGTATIALWSSPAYTHDLLPSMPSCLFFASMAAAEMLLGPGAHSLDARIFGRREVIIPQATRPSKF
jgi:uncharacterized membrane protein YphA (DoxX/SURF4 family)